MRSSRFKLENWTKLTGLVSSFYNFWLVGSVWLNSVKKLNLKTLSFCYTHINLVAIFSLPTVHRSAILKPIELFQLPHSSLSLSASLLKPIAPFFLHPFLYLPHIDPLEIREYLSLLCFYLWFSIQLSLSLCPLLITPLLLSINSHSPIVMELCFESLLASMCLANFNVFRWLSTSLWTLVKTCNQSLESRTSP